MNVHEKLEVFRKVYNLGQRDIEKAFEGMQVKDHLVGKYIGYRDTHGFDGNFHFLFALDEYNAEVFFNYINFK
jgi:hypothetical protein